MARPKENKLCETPGCKFTRNARGMCRTHYGAWLRKNKGSVVDVPRWVFAELTDAEKEHYWQWVKKELKLV